MRPAAMIAAASMLVAGCGDRTGGSAPPPDNRSAAAVATGGGPAPAPARPAEPSPALRWNLTSGGEGAALALAAGAEPPALRLFCPAGRKRLLVEVPGFRPVGSEERLSFGGGGEVAALVADPRGNGRRGGVTASGEVPKDLKALLEGPVLASYGAQKSGPHPAPPAALSSAFAAACGERPAAPAGPCLMQDGERLRTAALRAVGTEPFWGARIEGRCVTYSHPEDQEGTRVWTRFTAGPGGGTWAGSLGGRRFELRIRAEPGCSDGMSDRRYPLSAELLVGGERRRGCAEPLGAS